jgi:DNA (cytosine-5)-methyltransferase 1
MNRQQHSTFVALRSQLVKADPKSQSTDARSAARAVGKKIAGSISSHWRKSKKVVPGPIQVIDMFSGCGGMSAGFQSVNSILPVFRVQAAFDICEPANNSYEANLSARTFREDIRKLATDAQGFRGLLESAGYKKEAPTVLIGCAPCQGFSSHRNSDGEGDPRNDLFLNFIRVASEMSPDAIVMENVPELLTDRYFHYVISARKKLETAGYYVNVSVHNMAEFGVPQERFRALILAMKRPFYPVKGYLHRPKFKTVRDAIGGLPPVTPGVPHASDPMHVSAGHKQSTVDVIRQVPKDGGDRPSGVGPKCLREAKLRHGKEIYEDVYGRLAWSRPAITITGSARNPASGRFVHPEQHRGLTVREASLLQGFPGDFQFVGTLDEKFLQIGNAVPPTFSAYLAASVMGELLGAPLSAEDFDPGIEKPIGKSFSRVIPSLKAANSLSDSRN